jgi:hypothetical protein
MKQHYILVGATLCSLLALYGSSAVLLSGTRASTTEISTLDREHYHRREHHSLRKHLQQTLVPHLEFCRIRDTIYLLNDRYIEISLQRQTAILHYRNGDSLVIPISSGNPAVKEAISTPTGIFSVQNKSPEAISRQFGNTKMLWWIGFNYNVGMHGLEINSYYRHLGKRPSSHGCVRTGREDIETLYKLVDVGTPVIVYDSTAPARIFAFADTVTFDTTKAIHLSSRTKHLSAMMKQRLQALYGGRLFTEQPFALYMNGTTPLRPGGYESGLAELVITTQQKPLLTLQHGANEHRDYFAALQRSVDKTLPARTIAPDTTSTEEPLLATPKPQQRKRTKKQPLRP